jgi:G:T-mismatch repair DNA endonuclease (very short patch repair protein)
MRRKLTPDELKVSLEKKRQTCLERYGTPTYNNSQKNKETCLERYGTESPLQNKKIKQKQEQTCIEKYGVKNPAQNTTLIKKRKENNLKKYGVSSPTKLSEIKEKNKQTCLKKYGVEYIFQNKQIQKKRKLTNLKKYGYTCPTKNKKVIEKRIENNLKKYGVKHVSQLKEVKKKATLTMKYNFFKKLFQSERFKNLITPLFSLEEYKGVNSKKYNFECKLCKTQFETNMDNGRIPRCYHCFPVDHFTHPHKKISEFLNNQKIEHFIEKYIPPYFVDIFIKPNKIIEVYGDYWHGNPKFYKKGDKLNLPMGKVKVEEKWNYDKNRINKLKSKKYKTLILWEDEINNEFDMVKEKINNFITKE